MVAQQEHRNLPTYNVWFKIRINGDSLQPSKYSYKEVWLPKNNANSRTEIEWEDNSKLRNPNYCWPLQQSLEWWRFPYTWEYCVRYTHMKRYILIQNLCCLWLKFSDKAGVCPRSFYVIKNSPPKNKIKGFLKLDDDEKAVIFLESSQNNFPKLQTLVICFC